MRRKSESKCKWHPFVEVAAKRKESRVLPEQDVLLLFSIITARATDLSTAMSALTKCTIVDEHVTAYNFVPKSEQADDTK